MKSRGKEFEKNFKDTVLTHVKDGFDVDIQRLYDVIGKKTIDQPADFVCYKYPNEIYVECKSTHDSSFSYFTQPQYERLIKKAKHKGVKAGMLLWFVVQKKVFWLDIQWLQAFYESLHIKSVNVNKLLEYIKLNVYGVFEVEQKTIRINPEMNLKSLFEYITQEN